jgi:hypothetical protein
MILKTAFLRLKFLFQRIELLPLLLSSSNSDSENLIIVTGADSSHHKNYGFKSHQDID